MDLSSKNTELLSIGVLFLVTCVVFANSIFNGFVWDDHMIIVDDQTIKSFSNVITLFKSPAYLYLDDNMPYYRPVNRLMYMGLYHFFGLNPTVFHLVNILIHALNSILVYRLAQTLCLERYTALLGALIFAVHPINAESVNFISGSTDLLALFFTLGSYLLYKKGKEERKGAWFWLAGMLFLLGCLCKETTFMLILFIVLSECAISCASKEKSRIVLQSLSAYFVFALMYLALRIAALSGGLHGGRISDGLFTRLLKNVYVIPHYLKLILFPAKLNAYYTLPGNFLTSGELLVFGWLLILVCVCYLLVYRTKVAVFGLVWLGVNFIPISNIVPLPSAQIAERYMYLPAVGLWLIVAERCCSIRPQRLKFMLAICALMIALLGARTFMRNFDWKNDITLFLSIVAAEPNSAYGHYNLGNYYKNNGDIQGAFREWEKTVELNPKHSSALNQLANFYQIIGDNHLAEKYYMQAIEADQNNREAHYNLALIYEKSGKDSEALFHYEQFLKNIPYEHANLVPELTRKVNKLKLITGR